LHIIKYVFNKTTFFYNNKEKKYIMVDTLQGIAAKKVIEILTKQLVTPYFYTDPNTIKSVVKSKLKSMSLKCKISDNIKKLIVANTPKRSMYIMSVYKRTN